MPRGAQPKDGSVDAEELAFFARLKPAMRLSLTYDEIEVTSRRLLARGAHVCVSEERQEYLPSEGRRWHILYVARSMRQAEQLRDCERESMKKGTSVELGTLLGYPRCCIEQFVAMCERWNQRPTGKPFLRQPLAARVLDVVAARSMGAARMLARARRPSGTIHWSELAFVPLGCEDYVVGREGWRERPDARLNNLLFRTRARLISHAPCHYQCAPSIAYASAVGALIERFHPPAFASLKKQLTQTVVVAPTAARAIARCTYDGHILEAHAPRARNEPVAVERLRDLDAEFASLCENASADERGLVHGTPHWPLPVMHRFVWS